MFRLTQSPIQNEAKHVHHQCTAVMEYTDCILRSQQFTFCFFAPTQKISTTTSVDYFSALAELIANRAPKIHIPWLQATVTGMKYGKSETAALVNESKTDLDIIVASGKLEGSQPSTSTGTEGKELKVDLPTQIPDNEISPQARYLPVAIKRTIIIPKQGK